MTIRTGIGGWTYPEWRGGTFYPEGLRHADELAYAAERMGAIEIGHESFACPEFVDLACGAGVAIVWSEDEGRDAIADRTADFAYLRCQKMRSECPTGYDTDGIARIARMCRSWTEGHAPEGLPHAGERADSRGQGGDVFAMMINGAKERAPAAAMALAEELGGSQ